jgi:hypothetical protein
MMNINKGLARLWVVVSLPWSVWWGYEYYDGLRGQKSFHNLAMYEYEQIKYFNPDLLVTLNKRHESHHNYLDLRNASIDRKETAIIVGPALPLGYLLLWAALRWVSLGLRDLHNSTIR